MCTLKGAFSFHLHFKFSHPTSFDISSALKKIVAFLQSAQINSVETIFDLGQMTFYHHSHEKTASGRLPFGNFQIRGYLDMPVVLKPSLGHA